MLYSDIELYSLGLFYCDNFDKSVPHVLFIDLIKPRYT